MAPTLTHNTYAGSTDRSAPTVGIDVAVSLAEAIVESGFAAHAHGVDVLLADARRRRLPSVLIDIVADAGEPTVVRERALGRLLTQWDRVVDDGPCPDLYCATAA